MKPETPTFDVALTAYAYGGSCIGRLPDGRAVFVPFGMPGETVRVRLIEEKRGHARAEMVEVLKPSPERIAPRCVHFMTCGGCHYQHIPYARQLEAKAQIVRDQLERIGGIPNPPVQATVPCPNEYYYRNRVQFHLPPNGKLGYEAMHSNAVIAIQECHLPEPVLNETWPQLDFESIPGLERVDLRLGAGDDLLLALESSDIQPPEFSVDFPLSAVHLSPAGPLVLAGDDHVYMEVMGRAFHVSAESFFQVNTAVAEAMLRHLLEHLPLTPSDTLLELYCGVGLFSAFLAPRVKRLIGIELAPSAVEDFSINLDEFENVEIYQGPAETVLPALHAQPDVLLVDPPRAGIERRALESIVALRPRTIAYVSCDPSTLARDVKRLVGAGYRVEQVTPFDMFPQTYHVESIVLMTLSGSTEK